MRFPINIFTWFKRKPKEVTCPECLGDGRDEGWAIAFPCKACKGTGKLMSNHSVVSREQHRAMRQAQLNS
jgi:DnaJ-class molecular chaperone